MRRWLKIAVPLGIAVALLSVLAIGFGSPSGLAAPGGNGNGKALGLGNGNGGGKVTATVSIAEGNPHFGTEIVFAVEVNLKKESDFDKLWVANWCYQNGVAVQADFLPVVDGLAGPFTLGNNSTWTSGAADCYAYAFLQPYTHTPLEGGEMRYDVEA